MSLEPCLYAIDVNSHFARCYSIATKHGEPTHETAYINNEPVFVLARVRELIDREMNAVASLGLPNTHLVLVFDDPGLNFRHELDADYKGTRPPKPKSWTRQLELFYTLMQELGYPCLRVPGVEADDVIGTLATKLPQHGVKVVGFSGDKDMLSLTQHGAVWQYAGREKRLYDVAGAVEKMGVPHDRILDRLAMDGDTVDNIKGWPGVGEKKSRALLAHWSIDELVTDPTRIEQSGIKGAKGIAAWVRDNRKTIERDKALVTLKKDVNLGLNLNQMRRGKSALSPFFRQVLHDVAA